MVHVVYTAAEIGNQFFVEQAIAASRGDHQDELDLQNFASVAAAECVGSSFFIYRSALFDSSAWYRQNSYADCYISLAVRLSMGVQYVCAC